MGRARAGLRRRRSTKRAARSSAASPSSSIAAKAWKTWGTSGVTSSVTSTSAWAAWVARRIASSSRISRAPSARPSTTTFSPQDAAHAFALCGTDYILPLVGEDLLTIVRSGRARPHFAA